MIGGGYCTLNLCKASMKLMNCVENQRGHGEDMSDRESGSLLNITVFYLLDYGLLGGLICAASNVSTSMVVGVHLLLLSLLQ